MITRACERLASYDPDTDTVDVRDVFVNYVLTPSGANWEWCQSREYVCNVGYSPVAPDELAHYSQLCPVASPTADYVRFGGHSDYSGSLIDVSNMAVLLDTFGEYVGNSPTGVGLIRITGDYWSRALVLPTDARISAELADTLAAMLDEYPLVSESDYAEREYALIESHVESEYLSDLRETIGVGEWVRDAELRTCIFDALSQASESPYVESVESVVMPDAITDYVAERVPWLWAITGDTPDAGAIVRANVAELAGYVRESVRPDSWSRTPAPNVTDPHDMGADVLTWLVSPCRTITATRVGPDRYLNRSFIGDN